MITATALPAEALEDAFRKLTGPEDPTLEGRNRAVHRLFVDGVTVEYRAQDGPIRGAQARVIDFGDANNDWLAANQFTVSENKHTRRPDVVLFVNGLPLALIELKNAVTEAQVLAERRSELATSPVPGGRPRRFPLSPFLHAIANGLLKQRVRHARSWPWQQRQRPERIPSPDDWA